MPNANLIRFTLTVDPLGISIVVFGTKQIFKEKKGSDSWAPKWLAEKVISWDKDTVVLICQSVMVEEEIQIYQNYKFTKTD